MLKFFLRLFLALVLPMSEANSFAQGGPGKSSETEAEWLKKEVAELRTQIKELQDRRLNCAHGKSVQGAVNRWSPWSTCAEGFVATGLARIDIQGAHEAESNHVNDFQCGDQGCRAWCIGNACEVVARCCR